MIVPFETDLSIEPFRASPETRGKLNAIDRTMLGYTREVDHLWLGENRRGHFCRRNGANEKYIDWIRRSSRKRYST